MKNVLNYSKFIVSASSAVLVGLAPYFGSEKWYVAIVASVAALNVYLIANTPKS
jgi:hypothetical protein